MAATVTSKGQVTIPKQIRDMLGIVPGSKVDFRRVSDGSVVIIPLDAKRKGDRFERFRGHAGPGPSTDEIMAMTRGD